MNSNVFCLQKSVLSQDYKKSVISSILKMEASRSSKTLVSIGVTWLITLEIGGGGVLNLEL